MNFENLIEQLNKEGISLKEISKYLFMFFHLNTVYLSVEETKILNNKLIEILNQI
jgi:hypothetical protein